MAQLAILGHATRGKEIIEILEMLGGKNPYACNAEDETHFYFIVAGEIDYDEERYITDKYIVFTLEEFLEKFPYKVGDKVSSKYLKNYKIEKIEWKDITNRVIYKVQGMGWCSVNELQPYKEEFLQNKLDLLQQLKEYFDKTPKEIIEKEWHEYDKYNEIGPSVEEYLEYINNIRQPKYPTTYEECCDVLKIPNDERYIEIDVPLDYNEILYPFTELLICRDAYWKIAGDWKFDFDKECSYLCNEYGSVQKFEGIIDCNAILTFPTKEMRDAFFENFKELIEQCKELL